MWQLDRCRGLLVWWTSHQGRRTPSAPRGSTGRLKLWELSLADVAAPSRTVGAKPVGILDPRRFVVLATLRGSFARSVWIWARSTRPTKVTRRQWRSLDTQMPRPESSSQLTLRSASRSRRSRSPQMASSTWPHSLPELEDSVLLDLLVPSEVVGQLCDLGIQSCADLAMLWDSGRQCVQELEERMRTTFSEGLAAQVRAAWTTAWRESKSRREDHVRSVVQERCSSVLNPGTGSLGRCT